MVDMDAVTSWSVLLVDDEPDNVEVVAESLRFFGLTVRTAPNGVKGLEELKEFEPTLILLDLSMPGMDGWEMRGRVKADPKTKHIPVIALSAHAMVGDKERALQAGFDGYLAKPVSIATLLDDLRAVLKKETASHETPLEQADGKQIREVPKEKTHGDNSREVVSQARLVSSANKESKP